MILGLPKGLRDKFFDDTMLNLVAYGTVAVVGIILNFFIAGTLGAQALGVFHQGYALFVIVGQLAVFGIHDSAQRHIAQMTHAGPGAEAANGAELAPAALIAVLVTAVPAGILLYLLHRPIGVLTDSPEVGESVAIIAPGVTLFAVNKVLLGVLNGRRRSRMYAAMCSLRVIVVLIACVAIGLSGASSPWLLAAFTCSELILLPVLMAVTKPFRAFPAARIKDAAVRHLRFGARALSNSFLAESFIRIDILMLALFVGDAEIGIYSFAAMFIEGLYQIAVVVRTISNPVLVAMLAGGDRPALVAFNRKAAAVGLAACGGTAAMVLIAFPQLAPLFPDGMIEAALPILHILIVGVVFYAPFATLDQIVMQAGHPGRQSLLMAGNVSINVILNLILIQTMGITGAAIATAMTYGLSALTLHVAVRGWLGLRRGLFFV